MAASLNLFPFLVGFLPSQQYQDVLSVLVHLVTGYFRETINFLTRTVVHYASTTFMTDKLLIYIF
jgi:hypothetical protein